MRRVGFSTGAIALGDFRRALEVLRAFDVSAIELSALRLRELDPLLESVDQLDLRRYEHVAIHGPADFSKDDEEYVVRRLQEVADRDWLIVLHPDTITQYQRWLPLQRSLCFENMDKRKAVGRTMLELESFFQKFEESSLCFDIGHAHQIDRTMSEARLIVQKFSNRIRQIHVSEVNTFSQHVAVTAAAKYAFRKVLDVLPDDAPLIVESVIPESEIARELECVQLIFRQRVRYLLETD